MHETPNETMGAMDISCSLGSSRLCVRGRSRGENSSRQNNLEQYSNARGKQPKCWSRCSDRPAKACLSRRETGIQSQPVAMTAFERQEDHGGYSPVNKVTNHQGKSISSCIARPS